MSTILKLAVGLILATSTCAVSQPTFAESDSAPDGPIGLSCSGYIVPSETSTQQRQLSVKFVVNSDKTNIDISDGRDELSNFRKTDQLYTFETYFNRDDYDDPFFALKLRWSINRRTLQAAVQHLKLDLLPGVPVFDPRNNNRPDYVWRTYSFACSVVRVEAPI